MNKSFYADITAALTRLYNIRCYINDFYFTASDNPSSKAARDITDILNKLNSLRAAAGAQLLIDEYGEDAEDAQTALFTYCADGLKDELTQLMAPFMENGYIYEITDITTGVTVSTTNSCDFAANFMYFTKQSADSEDPDADEDNEDDQPFYVVTAYKDALIFDNIILDPNELLTAAFNYDTDDGAKPTMFDRIFKSNGNGCRATKSATGTVNYEIGNGGKATIYGLAGAYERFKTMELTERTKGVEVADGLKIQTIDIYTK